MRSILKQLIEFKVVDEIVDNEVYNLDGNLLIVVSIVEPFQYPPSPPPFALIISVAPNLNFDILLVVIALSTPI